MRKTLIVNGDSWTHGSEIRDPKLDESIKDYYALNDAYRIPKIYPTHLSNILDCDLVNLSWPADDNKSILNRTISYLVENYIKPKKSTKDLFVIVGWTSPERNSFWWSDDTENRKFRLWPHDPSIYNSLQKEFWKIYVTYLWNIEEYIPRYIMDVLTLQNLCNQYNIKWLCFNAFTSVSKNKNDFGNWTDLDVRKILNKEPFPHIEPPIRVDSREKYSLNYLPVWDTIDKIRFYKKDKKDNTFRSFISKNVNKEDRWNGIHPSPQSHKLWAKELYNYIQDNNLL
tara:strand:+ start:6405 stop:7256 length:852 start_codon:yes stop_codon:yes gene_type:complete